MHIFVTVPTASVFVVKTYELDVEDTDSIPCLKNRSGDGHSGERAMADEPVGRFDRSHGDGSGV